MKYVFESCTWLSEQNPEYYANAQHILTSDDLFSDTDIAIVPTLCNQLEGYCPLKTGTILG